MNAFKEEIPFIFLFICLGNKWRNPLHKENKRKQLYLYMGRLYSYCQKRPQRNSGFHKITHSFMIGYLNGS
jgi:hypothetical protein